jgi:hypothetical protein
MGELEYQLIRIPAGTHDDLPDALQSVCQLLSYPKEAAKMPRKTTAEDEFNWWRKQAIGKKDKPVITKHPFGKKQTFRGIPATESYR